MKKILHIFILLLLSITLFLPNGVFSDSSNLWNEWTENDHNLSNPELHESNLELSKNAISENSPIGSVIWKFSYTSEWEIINGSYSFDNSWDSANDNEKFGINGDKLVLKFVPDYENPVDVWDTPGNNTYLIKVKFKMDVPWGQGEIPESNSKEVSKDFIIKITDQDDYYGIVITLLWDNPQTVTEWETYVDPGATAVDEAWNDISDSIVSDAATVVDASKVDTYIVTYTATNSDWNSKTKTRTVEVVANWGGWWSGGGWSWWGWWGSGWTPNIDDCPNWDFSWDFFDWLCEAQWSSWSWTSEEPEWINKQVMVDWEMRDYRIKNRTCELMENILDDDYMPNFESNFTDISNLTPNIIKGIVKLEKTGVIKWRQAWKFVPKGNITRAEFLAIALYSHCYDVYKPATWLPFKDMQDLSDWKARVVQVWYDNWIIAWYDDNTFRPNDNISRIEWFAILMKLREIELLDKEKENNLTSSYTDRKASWQKRPLWLAEYLGVINPEDTNNKFYPNKKLKRDKMVEFLMDIMDLY